MEEFIQTPSFFWIFWGSATVFGILIGWALRAARGTGGIGREEFEMREQERRHLATVNAHLRESNDGKDADLKKALLELEHLRDAATRFEQEKNLSLAAVQSAALKQQSAQAETRAQQAKIQVFEEQVLGLRTRNAYLTGEVHRFREEINAWKSLHMDFSGQQKNIAGLEDAVAQIEQERNLARHELDAAYLEIENLQTELVENAAFSANGHGHASLARFAAAPVSPDVEMEDLKIINGITPFAERKLFGLGVSKIGQIAEWDEGETEAVNEALGFFPGRIRKEGWSGQARHLGRVKD